MPREMNFAASLAFYRQQLARQRAVLLNVAWLWLWPMIPSLAEPWFLTFNAALEFYPVMLPEDLGKAGKRKRHRTRLRGRIKAGSSGVTRAHSTQWAWR